jgi:outer membrane protein assembly factor BamD (BamD/ComL family)
VAAAEPPPDGDDPQPRVGGSEVTLRLNSQVVLIDGAWAAVKQHDAAVALRALSGYEQTFPSLDLHPEVLFLRVTAEDALGHKLGARAEAARIVALYPQSVQAKRARALLAQP